MDCIVQPQSAFWTGVVPHGLPSYPQRSYFQNVYFQRKPSFPPSFYPGHSLFFPHDDDVDYPTDIKGELTSTMPYPGMADENGEVKLCVVCGERASGFYFGALVCLPCKSFYIRCTKEGEPAFTCQCSGNCDIVKQGRIRCQFCRYQRCLLAGMCRKEKPESVQPAEGQVLCKVCGDIANGIHFGVNTCEGCKKFFRRGLVENQSYVCKNEKDCCINPRNRNNCRYCRYQKCIAVGMSREAIKMGRPKKAEGSELSNNPESPKLRRHEVDVDNNSQPMTNPCGSPQQPREESNDTLNANSVRETIKQEPERSSCNYEKKAREMWSNGERNQTGMESSWQPCGQMTQSSGAARQNVTVNEFGEDDMDDILKLLQDDHQNSQEHKKMRGYGYTMAAVKECKTEFCERNGSHDSSWHVPEGLPVPQQQGMPAMGMAMSEPMNMTTGQMAQIPSRPPPQYPGIAADYHPDQHSLGSPHSPRQMHSPGSSYMSDSSAHSPGYVPNGCSPVHSPCQYSPSHSPSYQQNCPSPQSTSYHYDSSPQGSPMYQQNGFNSPNTYLDLSVNVNCSQSVMTPSSPSHAHSPIYNNMSTNQSSTSLSMTIPTQEGGVNSQDSWFMIGSPSQCCHSPSQTIPQSDRGYKQRGATWNENLQRINNFFNNQCERSELHLLADEDVEGTMTRNDVEREVVHKLLSSVSPSESYFYVMSDNHSSDSNSGSNYDEFTSCRRMNKRKTYDDSDMCDSSSVAGFHVGKYKRQLTEKYWYLSAAMEEAYPMTTEKQSILEHLSRTFQQMADKCTETAKRCNNPQDARSWHQIQMRIVKNTSAFVKFALQIPGFSSIHPEDKSFLCQHVSFMCLMLMAGHQLYNPAEKNFRDFWNWNINHNNPFYGFKQRLLELGQRIHDTKMDAYEIASLEALIILASDFADLAYPEAIEDSRRKIISALRSYELSKGVNVKSRLGELFSLVPAVRHVGIWHHELMRQMKLRVQPQDIHQLVDSVNYTTF